MPQKNKNHDASPQLVGCYQTAQNPLPRRVNDHLIPSRAGAPTVFAPDHVC